MDGEHRKHAAELRRRLKERRRRKMELVRTKREAALARAASAAEEARIEAQRVAAQDPDKAERLRQRAVGLLDSAGKDALLITENAEQELADEEAQEEKDLQE